MTDLWNIIIVNPMMNALVFIYSIIGNYGLAILIFTLLIKLITLPFTVQQQKSMRAQAAVQPELQALQKKYGKDKQKYQQEMTKLYKERGINPLGGCLPMLIPWPLFLAFYQSVSSVMSTQPEQFMVLSQHIVAPLANRVPVNETFLWLNLARPDPFYILPLLAVATTWLQQKMTVMPSADPQASSMNQTMGLFMPLFMGYITMSFASGLAIYWVMFNIIGIIQQYYMTGWGDLGKMLPKPILRVLPGPKNAPMITAPAVSTAAKTVDAKPRRRARVDADAADAKAARRPKAAVAEADNPTPPEVKLPRRRAADQDSVANSSATIKHPVAPSAAVTDPTRKVRRKTPAK